MNIEWLQGFFGWCAFLNILILIWWILAFVFARDFIFSVHGRWFKMTPENFNAIHYAMMGFFKIGIFFFNLIPYFALRIMG